MDQLKYPLSSTDKKILKDVIEQATFSALFLQRVLMAGSVTNDSQSNQAITYILGVNINALGPLSDFSRQGSILQLQAQDNLSSAFLQGFLAPLIQSGVGSITNGGSTLTDTTRNFTTNELAGLVLYLASADGSTQEAHVIASNTATVITITGTWAASTNSYTYNIAQRVYLGAANSPWKRLYANEIRLGEGASSSSTVSWIRTGTGSPESVETAPVGSIFLRRDGGAGTTLYVKESGTGNTGWVGK